MNSKLIESLVQVIESLPQDDYLLFQKQLAVRSIQKMPGICGGNARIRNTRIPVWTIVSLQQQGADDTELLDNYPSLTPFDLLAVKMYYIEHHQEIDTILANYGDDEFRELQGELIK
ncbi:MAG: DUF433 domain-containing protein [Cyanobacterium sp. T60_A2020_053]|nr:DUF433 domain-containing protein [Cyanobacterium sp. T60_A2020_053]